MAQFPHTYQASASTRPQQPVTLRSPELPDLASAPPAEFGGPGDQWSPETLFTAALVDCYTLTFQALARASKFEWAALECQAQGTLDRVDGSIRFTRFDLQVRLTVPAGTPPERERAVRLLEKSKQHCFITQSVKADCALHTEIVEA